MKVMSEREWEETVLRTEASVIVTMEFVNTAGLGELTFFAY